jgi:hypothetical protein
VENFAPTGIRSSDRPVAIPTELPGPHFSMYDVEMCTVFSSVEVTCSSWEFIDNLLTLVFHKISYSVELIIEIFYFIGLGWNKKESLGT